MSNAKSKQAKPKTGLARCMELASDRKGLVFLAAVLSSLAAVASFIPYIAVYFMIRSIIGVFPNLDQLDMGMVMNYGWLALAGIVANILLYFLAIFSSHMAAFGTLYELKVLFADHITKIPLGYHLTIGSGRLRKIMDENIESVEGFIAHQFPDFVASITAPIVMVIILLAVDWRFGLASLVGIILAFVAEFIKNGFMSVFGVMTARATAALWQSISAGYGLKLLHIPTICMLKRFGGVDTNGSSKLPQALFISPKKPCSLCNCLCCTRSLSIRNDFFDLW